MNNKLIGTIVLAAALSVGLAACSTAEPGPQGVAETGSSTSPSTPAETPDVTTGAPEAGTPAALAWEALMGPYGEYAAVAAYTAVIEEFGQVQPYVNILEAEQRHVSALIRQLDRFGVSAPANPWLGKIPAPADLLTTAQAEADGEVANVAMYDELLAQSNDAGLTRVLTNLRRASLEAHLPMFEAAAENGGTLTNEQMTELGFGH